jgi:hypothetical protein
MKKIFPVLLSVFLLASCNGWVIQPLPGNPPTPFLPFTQSPSIFTGTPVIIGVTSATPTPAVASPTASVTLTAFPTFTPSPIGQSTFTVTSTSPTVVPSGGPAISITVLGCNTSIDVLNGMGEVTNAYVTLKNSGGVELTNIKATLFALDEGRVHPDKTVELTSLPVGYQVTIKLTVDSTYQQETPIQVEVTSNQGAFPREGLASCRDIGLLAPNPAGLTTPIPAAP